jgi:hypothetical protein
MSRTRVRMALGAAACVAWVTPALAQPAARPAPPQEIYHVHVVKAAAGKLPDLIEAYKYVPGPDSGDPQVTPIVLRHREGGEWDLIVITPRGKDHTLRSDAPPQSVQDFNQRIIPVTDWHADTFAVGPVWDVVQKALVPARAAQAVYTVTDYRALTGHRPQLRQTLDRIEEQSAGRSVLFAHIEGEPWNFLSVTRYDSWADLGQQQTAPSGPQDPSMDLRRDMAVHHDTVATYVSGGEARK